MLSVPIVAVRSRLRIVWDARLVGLSQERHCGKLCIMEGKYYRKGVIATLEGMLPCWVYRDI